MLGRCGQWGMLGEGQGQSTAVLAHALVPASWDEQGEMAHPAGTFVSSLSESASQGVCAPGSPELSSHPSAFLDSPPQPSCPLLYVWP